MKYPILIFDLDGTLVDPLQGIFLCMNHALRTFGYPPRSEQDIMPLIGPPLEISLRKLSGSDDESRIRELVATYRQRYGEVGYRENTVYAGVPAMLDSLRRAGTPMGVCTSKFQPYAIKVLEEFELSDYFGFVSGPTELGTSKRAQLAALLQDKAVTPASLMIGDRAVDLSAAHDNGLFSAGVCWGYGSREELLAEKPALLFDSPQDLSNTLLEL